MDQAKMFIAGWSHATRLVGIQLSEGALFAFQNTYITFRPDRKRGKYHQKLYTEYVIFFTVIFYLWTTYENGAVLII